MLIMIDGTASIAELSAKARSLGVPENFMDQLIDGGFVAREIAEPAPVPQSGAASKPAAPAVPPRPAVTARPGEPVQSTVTPAAAVPAQSAMGEDEFARFVAAQKFMNGKVSDVLGFRGLPLVLKIERASSRRELRALAEEFSEKIAKSLGLRARPIVDELKTLLQD
jgi:hypothetical protein